MKTKLKTIALAISTVLAAGMAQADSFTITTTADFTGGGDPNITTNPPPNTGDGHIRLVDTTTTRFEFIWVALSGRGTVAKIDTTVDPTTIGNGDNFLTEIEAGGTAVKGEYRSAPSGMQTNPSRTTVDLNGDVWVGNRNEAGGGQGSVAKIAQNPTGTTSSGVWNDASNGGAGGTFNALPWANTGGVDSGGGTSTATDSALSQYVRTTGTNVRTVAIDANNNVWVGGLGNKQHQLYDSNGNPVVGAGNSFNQNPHGGYGGLVDGNGVLWSASSPGSLDLVRHDPATNTTQVIDTGRQTYGLGIDQSGNIWMSNWTNNSVQKLDSNGNLLGTFNTQTFSNRGVAVTADGHVWVAGSGSNNVARLDNNGNLLARIAVGATPTGVAVDAAGKVWVTNQGSDSVMRIDPSVGLGTVDLTIDLGPNSDPYNYSDMTGAVSSGITNPTGVWSYVLDSTKVGTIWDQIFWNEEGEGDIPAATSLVIDARAAATQAGLGSALWTSYTSGDALSLNGQFLEIRATLGRTGANITPVLSDIRVTTRDGQQVPAPATLALLGLGAVLIGFRRRNRSV